MVNGRKAVRKSSHNSIPESCVDLYAMSISYVYLLSVSMIALFYCWVQLGVGRPGSSDVFGYSCSVWFLSVSVVFLSYQ